MQCVKYIDEVIGLSPPLNITRDEIDEAIANMDIALEAADAHTHR